MRHSIVILVVVCTAFVSAQNRGSVRYLPPEDYDGESTRAPRPSGVRGAGLRRGQRPTPTTEVPEINEELKPYEPENPVRTVGRRIIPRTHTRQVAPPPPPPLPVLDLPLEPAAPKEAPEAPPTSSEGRPQGTRRRRPKKRRKPQPVVPKVQDEADKQSSLHPRNEDSESETISRNLHPKEELQGGSQSRNPHPNFAPEHPSWGNDPHDEQPARDIQGQQYFRPQTGTNRLPVDNTGKDGYLDDANVDLSSGYAPNEYAPPLRNGGDYIPVLSPIQVQSEGNSRLPPEKYSRPSGESDRQNRHPTLNEAVREQPIYNSIPEQPSAPVRGHSEVRLPEEKQPEYGNPHSESVVEQPHAPEISGRDRGSSNRLPNRYDPSYSEYSNTPQRSEATRGSRAPKHADRPVPASYTPHRRVIETKPQEHDNEAGYDHRQSQYQPPLQRAGSRYKPDDSDSGGITRTRTQPPEPSSRSRGLSRYSPSVEGNEPTRTRVPTTRPSASHSDSSPTRTRSSSNSQSTSRGSQRYAPEPERGTARTNSRNPSGATRNVVNSAVPLDDVIKNDYRSQPSVPRTYNQPPAHLVEESEPDVYPIRDTLRSRPQYDVRDKEPIDAYEEPAAYDDEHRVTRQPPRTDRRPAAPPHPEEPLQSARPDYGVPQNSRSRQSPQYQAPQNARSRQQPQYDRNQDPRDDYRQPSPRQNVPNRQAGRSRQEPEAPRSPKASKFRCPEAYGFFADPVQCDKYYECRNGTADEHLCSDGLAFNEASAPKFVRCDSLRDVDCKSRPELQEPQSSKNCPRRFGLYSHETDCTKFWNCVDGTATEVQCPPGLTYNDRLGTCDWADLVETSCKSEDLLGFTCPEPTAYDLQDGVYSSYPHPSNCQLHFICIKGADGQRRPRLLTCNEGLVFDERSSSCTRPENVPGCEEFYGPVTPRKKPARQPPPRQPEPEEEVYEEPTPRRRGSSYRRTRN